MNRVDKIKLLNGIRDGRLSRRVLMRPKTYLFTEHTGDEIYYENDGKRLTKNEYDHFCNEIESDNRSLKSLGLKDLCTVVITIVYVKGKTIL